MATTSPVLAAVLSFGDRISCGDYRVLSRFDKAINLLSGGRLACIVLDQIGGGPLNIVLSGPVLPPISRLQVSADCCVLEDMVLPRNPVFDSSLPAGAVEPALLEKNLRALERILINTAHPKSLAFLLDAGRCGAMSSGFERALVGRFQACARAFQDDDLATGAKAARGAGFGLTPSGDDLLCGYLWGLHFLKGSGFPGLAPKIEEICRWAQSSNPLSQAFLSCAAQGRCFQRLRDLLAALSQDDPALLAARARGLLSAGETSGADTCVGLLMALRKEGVLWS